MNANEHCLHFERNENEVSQRKRAWECCILFVDVAEVEKGKTSIEMKSCY